MERLNNIILLFNNNIVLYCCAVLYCTVLYCTVLCCTVLYCTVLYCTVLEEDEEVTGCCTRSLRGSCAYGISGEFQLARERRSQLLTCLLHLLHGLLRSLQWNFGAI